MISRGFLIHVYTSADSGSRSMKTLYRRRLSAGPILASVRAPFLLADFCNAERHGVSNVIRFGMKDAHENDAKAQ